MEADPPLVDCTSLYTRLKLPKTATTDEIDNQIDTQAFQKIRKDEHLRPLVCEAHRVLVDPTSRQKYDDFGLYDSGNNDASQILDRLWLGTQFGACNHSVHKKGNIGSILSLMHVKPFCISQFGVRYKYVYLEDVSHADLIALLMECLDWIQLQLDTYPDQSVFVHCQAGASRSASIVIAYVMRTQKLDFETAKKFVQSKRPEVDPNSGFCEQLRSFTFPE